MTLFTRTKTAFEALLHECAAAATAPPAAQLAAARKLLADLPGLQANMVSFASFCV